jgi:glycosyltransferase involved in cell wall biosynthesis
VPPNTSSSPVDKWSVAVFAHNEAKRIRRCLDSLLTQDTLPPPRIVVLVNGSTDKTADIVDEFATRHPSVQRVTLPIGDKAAAWNHYVHDLAVDAEHHAFVDGDVHPLRDALPAIGKAFARQPAARAVGATPASGRNRVGWARRMVTHGRLAGGLYALRRDMVDELRERDIRLPLGLIGEDLFVSCLAKAMLHPRGMYQASPQLVIAADARFAFDSLSLARPGDWLTYLRRLVRYRVRDHQLSLLLNRLAQEPHRGMPSDMAALYREAAALPDYYWRGLQTPFDMIAVHQLKRVARQKRDTNQT